MNAEQLFRAGKLNEAISALGSLLRDRPDDLKNRTFLFELLCFAGEFERAEKQLNIIEEAGKKESEKASASAILQTLVRADRKAARDAQRGVF